jgi:hypothetical protein
MMAEVIEERGASSPGRWRAWCACFEDGSSGSVRPPRVPQGWIPFFDSRTREDPIPGVLPRRKTRANKVVCSYPSGSNKHACAARRAMARDLGSQPNGACLAQPGGAGSVRPRWTPGARLLFAQWALPEGPCAGHICSDSRGECALGSQAGPGGLPRLRPSFLRGGYSYETFREQWPSDLAGTPRRQSCRARDQGPP